MKFNTAILYDIENLIGGYGSRMDYISALSLKDILDEIKKVDILGGIAIQRAYANWSDPRLNVMRGDIIDLGIEPIQMFGFGKGATKNASDIQLAIDAVDLALTRPSLETFVIVSGDGGFSALAKKLHEHGKAVVGCAYRRSTNRVFEAVCDRFVWITEIGVDGEEQRSALGAAVSTDPLLKEFFAKISCADDKKPFDMIQKAKFILEQLANTREGQYLLKTNGMNISIAAQALSIGIKEFTPVKCGFVKFVDFLRYVLHGSKLALVHRPPSEYRLAMAGTIINGFETVKTTTEPPSIHTEENYRMLLATDTPIFRLPPYDVLVKVAACLALQSNSIQRIHVGDIIGMVTESTDLEQQEAKDAVLSYVSAGVFLREPEDKKLSEQYLTLQKQTQETIIFTLRERVRGKLLSTIGEINENVFLKIMS